VLGRHTVSSLVAACALFATACGSDTPDASQGDGIAVGALLPFTGKEAAIGRNLEQALLLAVADVNAAGGIDGQPLRLITRDSNSGSERGLDQLLQLLYSDQVSYLIGPEETQLAQEVVPDIKALNVLELLPGYAAPSIEHSGTRGAWIRLAPSTEAFACAMGKQVVRSGALTVNALIAVDDYSPALASDFTSRFGSLGGKSLPSVSVPIGASSYATQIERVIGYGTDVTLLMAPPESAATITTEWTIDGRHGNWYLSPLLRADGFLQNIPFGTLDGALGLSPSTSLASECTSTDTDELHCTHSNASAFAQHFSDYWQGDRPFPVANYYYDALVLLALALNKGTVEDDTRPGVRGVHDDIRELGDAEGVPMRWTDLRAPFSEVRLGTQVRYIGAAAEYEFDVYGAAKHTVFDTWAIDKDGFVDTGTVKAVCPIKL
jgi:neutral amino acid transport system substrate-binding protein